MPVKPGRRRLSPAARRAEILTAASELIARSGFDGVSLDAFAKASGLTKAGLLHHFASREHILVAVLERRDSLDLAAIELAAAAPALDPAEAQELMTRVVRRNLEQRSVVQMYTVLAAEALDPAHAAHTFFQHRLKMARTQLAERVLPWHPRADIAAVELLAFLDGLQLNWLRDPTIDFLAQWDAFTERFFSSTEPTRSTNP